MVAGPFCSSLVRLVCEGSKDYASQKKEPLGLKTIENDQQFRVETGLTDSRPTKLTDAHHAAGGARGHQGKRIRCDAPRRNTRHATDAAAPAATYLVTHF